jgi:hypothetical protein
MATNRFALFSDMASYVKIPDGKFLEAIKKNDLEQLLELKKQGCTLDINTNDTRGKNALEIALERKDFDIARQLINAGANLGVYTTIICGDGWTTDTTYRSFFDSFANKPYIINFLKKEAPLQFLKHKYGYQFSLEDMKEKVEQAKNAFEEVTAEYDACYSLLKNNDTDVELTSKTRLNC